MMRNALLVVAVATCTLLVEASAAFAGDPSKVGQHLEDIVRPNVKSFWKLGLLVAALVTIFSRAKASMLVAVWVGVILSGAVIYNPGGMAEMVSNVGHKVL